MADKNNTLLFVVIAVVVILVGAVGAYMIFGNDDDDSNVGMYAEYTVTGSYGGTTYDGVMKMTIIDETSKRVKVENEYNIYQTKSGSRTPFIVDTEIEWEDKEDDSFTLGVKQSSETISTKWGSKNVDVWLKVDGTSSMKSYVDKNNYDIVYRMESNESGFVLTFELNKTNIF